MENFQQRITSIFRFLNLKAHRSFNLLHLGSRDPWTYLEIQLQLGQVHLFFTSTFFRTLLFDHLWEQLGEFFSRHSLMSFFRFLGWVFLIRYLFWLSENKLYLYPTYSQLVQSLLLVYIFARLFLPALTFANARKDFFFTFYFFYLGSFLLFSSKLSGFLDFHIHSYFLDQPSLYNFAWVLSIFSWAVLIFVTNWLRRELSRWSAYIFWGGLVLVLHFASKKPLLLILLLLLLHTLFDEWIQYSLFLADSRIPLSYKVLSFSQWIWQALRGRKPTIQVQKAISQLDRELNLFLRKIIAQKWKNYFFKILKDCPQLKSNTKKGG